MAFFNARPGGPRHDAAAGGGGAGGALLTVRDHDAPLRAGPHSDASVVGLLAAGSHVRLLGVAADGETVQVQTASGQTGWLAAQAVAAPSDTAAGTGASPPPAAVAQPPIAQQPSAAASFNRPARRSAPSGSQPGGVQPATQFAVPAASAEALPPVQPPVARAQPAPTVVVRDEQPGQALPAAPATPAQSFAVRPPAKTSQAVPPGGGEAATVGPTTVAAPQPVAGPPTAIGTPQLPVSQQPPAAPPPTQIAGVQPNGATATISPAATTASTNPAFLIGGLLALIAGAVMAGSVWLTWVSALGVDFSLWRAASETTTTSNSNGWVGVGEVLFVGAAAVLVGLLRLTRAMPVLAARITFTIVLLLSIAEAAIRIADLRSAISDNAGLVSLGIGIYVYCAGVALLFVAVIVAFAVDRDRRGRAGG